MSISRAEAVSIAAQAPTRRVPHYYSILAPHIVFAVRKDGWWFVKLPRQPWSVMIDQVPWDLHLHGGYAVLPEEPLNKTLVRRVEALERRDRGPPLPPDTVGASGEWPSLEARAEHIADAYRHRRGSHYWQKVYDRALAHLRAVTR